MTVNVRIARPPAVRPGPEAGSVPRDVVLTRDGKALAILAVCLAVGALGLGAWLTILHDRQTRDRELRSHDSILTAADVVRVTRTRGDHPRQVVTYRFRAGDGQSHVATARLGEGESVPAFAGGTIPIGYLHSDPERSWISGFEPEVMPVWVAPLAGLVLAAIAGMVALRLRSERALLTEGRVVEGRVVATKRVTRQHHRATRLSYEFTTLAGARVEGRSEMRRGAPAVGERVTVVYHRDNARWNRLYPLPLVRPARS